MSVRSPEVPIGPDPFNFASTLARKIQSVEVANDWVQFREEASSVPKSHKKAELSEGPLTPSLNVSGADSARPDSESGQNDTKLGLSEGPLSSTDSEGAVGNAGQN